MFVVTPHRLNIWILLSPSVQTFSHVSIFYWFVRWYHNKELPASSGNDSRQEVGSGKPEIPPKLSFQEVKWALREITTSSLRTVSRVCSGQRFSGWTSVSTSAPGHIKTTGIESLLGKSPSWRKRFLFQTLWETTTSPNTDQQPPDNMRPEGEYHGCSTVAVDQ